MASEITAAQYGDQGAVRRDPMAMLPFCGYNMADYFAHWLDFGKKITKPPGIFHVNWFKKDEAGRFIWPGFGENIRALNWIIQRTRGEAGAERTPIGFVPAPVNSISQVLIYPKKRLPSFCRGPAGLARGADDHKRFFEQFGERLPQGLRDEHQALRERFAQS